MFHVPLQHTVPVYAQMIHAINGTDMDDSDMKVLLYTYIYCCTYTYVVHIHYVGNIYIVVI